MKTIKAKELLELFAATMISRKKSFFNNTVIDIVPLSEQVKWVKKYAGNIQAVENGYKISSAPGTVIEVPRYNFFLFYDTPVVNETLIRFFFIIKNLSFI